MSRQPELVELYKLVVDEEHRDLEQHHARVSFFVGLISALFAATFLGVTQSTRPAEALFLCGSPILICGLSVLGRKVSQQFYERFLSSVTMRAKLEQCLDLTEPAHVSESSPLTYWAKEPLIPERHLKSRREEKDTGSGAWVQQHLGTGYDGSAKLLFNLAFWSGVALLVGLVVFAWHLYLNS